MAKLCVDCLDYEFGAPEFCSRCGSKMVEWELKCQCGTPISPAFTVRWFPPWGKVPLYKHCPHCGRRIDKLVIEAVKRLRRKEAT